MLSPIQEKIVEARFKSAQDAVRQTLDRGMWLEAELFELGTFFGDIFEIAKAAGDYDLYRWTFHCAEFSALVCAKCYGSQKVLH